MASRRVSIVALALLLGAGSSCASQTCTEVACDDTLTFHFDEKVPRDYTLTVEIAGKTGTADCTSAALSDTSAELLANLSGELDFGVSCGPDFVSLFSSPGNVAIVIEFSDGTTTNADAKPVYEENRPNGEDCGPVCDQASFDIDVHPPRGG